VPRQFPDITPAVSSTLFDGVMQMTKTLTLRRPDTCSMCDAALDAGTRATWDSVAKKVTCLACATAANVTRDATVEVDVGVAGASARAKGQKLQEAQLARREALKTEHPVLGRIGIALAGPATEGQTWLKGAVGEEQFGTALESMRGEGVLPLHDRRVPRSSANIDHIAVTPNGVWVIDPKRYDGKVQVVDKGGWFRTDIRLYVNGRDRTKLVAGVHKQRGYVRAALAGTEFEDAPVCGALCFVDSEWPLFAKPKFVDGVVVAWGKALRSMLTEVGDLDADQCARLHQVLGAALPPKRS
jgi:hypothetical protein